MRHERKLLAVPVLPCPDLPQKKTEKVNSYKSIYYIRYAAEVRPVDGENVLSVTTFHTDGTPCNRFWQVGEQNGLDVFRSEEYCYQKKRVPGKMYEAAIDSVYDGPSRWYSGNETRFYGLPEDADAILRFLGKPDEDREKAVLLLVEYQRECRRKILETRDEKKRSLIRQAFEGIQAGAPEGFKKWCERVPMQEFRYFFYDYTGKPEQEGVCSYCGKTSKLPGIRERKLGTCPACGSTVKFWSLKRLRGSYGIRHRTQAATCQIVNGRVVVRCFTVGIELEAAPVIGIKKELWACEDRRSFLDTKTGRELERYETPTGTTKVYVDGLAKSSTYETIGDYAMAPVNIAEIRKGMGLYAPLEALAEHGNLMDPVAVWQRARKSAAAEYLIKLGLFGLAENELKGGYKERDVLRKGKNVAELLGVPKDMVRQLRNVDPSATAMLTIRGLTKCGVKLTEQDMKDLNTLNISWRHAKTLQQMQDWTSIHKALRYIKKQLERCPAFGDAAYVLQTWRDYTGMAKEAGKNTEDIHVALPKALKAAHDETAKLLRMKKDREMNERVGKSAKCLQDLCWTWNGLTIRPAESQEELFVEGETLSHCVGRYGYAEKMAKFQTAIFFIRKAEDPGTPFVTLELSLTKWEKIQCYGKCDKWPGKLVDSFVAKWVKNVVKPSRTGIESKTA